MKSDKQQMAVQKPNIGAFLANVVAGLAQAEQDLLDIDSATSLADAKPILKHITNRQLRIMKALRYVAMNYESDG